MGRGVESVVVSVRLVGRAAATGSKQNALLSRAYLGVGLGANVRPLLLLLLLLHGRRNCPKLLSPNVQQHQPASFRPCPKGHIRLHYRSQDRSQLARCTSMLFGVLAVPLRLIADDEARLFSSASRSAARVGCERFHLHLSTASCGSV